MTQTSNLVVGPKPNAVDLAQPPDVIVMSPADMPDETWSVDQLLEYGNAGLREGEECDRLAVPLARRSIVARCGAGHAYSILRSRFRPLRKWCGFQTENDLPRTSVWEVMAIYEAAVREGLTSEEIAGRYSTWTEVLLAYGLARPRKTKGGGHVVELLEMPEEDEEGQDVYFNDDVNEGDGDGVELDGAEEPHEEDSEDDGNHDESGDEPQHAEPAAQLITDGQVAAAATFLGAVGGLKHAVRVLMSSGVNSGDKAAVKDALAEAVKAARAILAPSEFSETVIVSHGKATGIDWVAV